jgi:F-type H+-transporting ATPase subunit delta
MADKTTIARPYAKAAFAEARGDSMPGTLVRCDSHTAATVVDGSASRIRFARQSARDVHGSWRSWCIDIAGPASASTAANFVRTLAENHRRLAYLPEISALFDELKDEAEGIADVTVTSAAPLDARGSRRR